MHCINIVANLELLSIEKSASYFISIFNFESYFNLDRHKYLSMFNKAFLIFNRFFVLCVSLLPRFCRNFRNAIPVGTRDCGVGVQRHDSRVVSYACWACVCGLMSHVSCLRSGARNGARKGARDGVGDWLPAVFAAQITQVCR